MTKKAILLGLRIGLAASKNISEASEIPTALGNHTFLLKWTNPVEGIEVPIMKYLVFSD